MRGGKPGYFPPLSEASFIPGSSLDYYDPFGWSKGKTEEQKANGLVKEINNGRLAMIGILGFLAEGKTPGSVPVLSGIIPSYSGEPMVSPSSRLGTLGFVSFVSSHISMLHVAGSLLRIYLPFSINLDRNLKVSRRE